MALIKCPDCGKEFSDQATACPNCGRPNQPVASIPKEPQNNTAVPLNQRYRDSESTPKKNSGLSIAALVLSIMGCTFVLGIILAIIDLCKKDTTKKHGLSKAALIICALWIVLSIAFGSNNEKDQPASVTTETVSSQSAVENIDLSEETLPATTIESEVPVEYISVTATELSDALNNNALKAKETYADQYLEITGKLGNIDSNGKYIDIDADDFSFTIIQCYIKTEEQKNIIMEKSKGDSITVRGFCKGVGEIMGYSIDIETVE